MVRFKIEWQLGMCESRKTCKSAFKTNFVKEETRLQKMNEIFTSSVFPGLYYWTFYGSTYWLFAIMSSWARVLTVSHLCSSLAFAGKAGA